MTKFENTMLNRLIEEYNNRSELVALNYAQKEEGKCDNGTLQWNRGALCKIEQDLEFVAAHTKAKLAFTCGKHSFGYDDWNRELEYITVERF